MMIVALSACASTPDAEVAPEADTASAANDLVDDAIPDDPATGVTPDDDEILIVFTNLDESFEFCISVREGIETEVARRGWNLVNMDNQLDGTISLANTRSAVELGADLIIKFNPDSAIAPAIMDIVTEAGIPTIAVDIPLPGAPYFGANNFVAGEVGGVALAELGLEEFGPEIDFLVVVTRPDGGELIIERQDGIIAGARELYPDLTDDQIIILDGRGDVLPSQEVFTAFLTANPDATRILVGSVNDQSGQGAFAAAEIANRQDHVLIISQGADTSALDNLRMPERNAWRGSVSYAPELYGYFMMPTVELMLAGEPFPMYTYVDHFIVTWDNINDIYPQ